MANTNNIEFQKISRSSGDLYSITLETQSDSSVTPKIIQTDSPAVAKKEFNTLKEEYPQATVNGQQNYDPFEGDTNAPANTDLPAAFSAAAEDEPPAELPSTPFDDLSEPQFDPYEDFSDAGFTSAPAAVAAVLTKAARDVSGVASWRLQEYKEVTPLELAERNISGVGGERRLQAMVSRENLQCENIIRGIDNNAFIILGNDRQTHELSGYGGAGHTQCDMIDIVAGMGGSSPRESGIFYDENIEQSYEKELPYHPDFFVDAARIYISQKRDIDRNFGLRQYKNVAPFESNPLDPGPNGAKSAIGMKADNIRVVARETLDIVTGTDSKNAVRGDLSAEKTGINIVANNNYDALQPMVLGDNLNQALRSLTKKVEDLSNIVFDFINHQKEFNDAIGKHKHGSPFFGTLKTTQSDIAKAAAEKAGQQMLQDSHMSILRHILNMAGFRSRYLSPSGSKYIKSPNNRVN